ncbi:heat-inducible transcriptional repressor HrcA [Schaalia sp. lx-260]|uniref:heat-inducible transcriptional repressor HrcA n=1 Tax=Schaalia sp. lx-260 TaxID=2899082 RepID=UPI001E488B20|nr:heat-inducible transcriptional repressor HrcA [Schaalia sp. lx-260]MCD4549461.1 heat-inducible transcriptional repressor HrcA [Schaalia sp. lx-260]
MNEERRLDVLRAIVSEYVHTREPVGSKVIAAAHDLGVSSATIRNDMAALEEAGLIYQPHTSAGRVPTDKGYRLFVDRLTTIKPMSTPERRAVEAFLAQSVDLDDVVSRTVRLLAQVTQQVAVIQYPRMRIHTVRRIEIVDLTPHRLLVVVITSEGRVEERIIETSQQVSVDEIARLRIWINEVCEGLSREDVREHMHILPESNDYADTSLISDVMKAVAEMLHPGADSRIVMAGMANLTRSGVDFRDISPVLDALEEQVALLRLFDELTPEDEVHVTIGSENQHDGLTEASIVTGTYGGADGPMAHLGVVGPTRMDYARTMSSVRAVAAYLSRYLTH